MKKTILLLALPFLLGLASCSNGQAPSSSSTEESSSESTSSSIVSSEESSESSKSFSSTEPSGPVTSFHLQPSDIPPTSAQAYNYDFDFFTTNGEGRRVNFHGDNVQIGNGKWKDTYDHNYIQMKKNAGFFYNLTPVQGTISYRILKSGQFTGVPSIFTGSDVLSSVDGLTALTMEDTTSSDTLFGTYSFAVDGYFRVDADLSFACYITDMVLA